MADRGYESFNTFAHLIRKGMYFVIRMKEISSMVSVSYTHLKLDNLIFLLWQLYNKSASTILTVFCFDWSSGTIYNPFYKCKT